MAISMDPLENRREILRYIAEHGVTDKDKRGKPAGPGSKKSKLEKTRKGGLRKIIDLHGMTVSEAGPALSRTMEECEKKGIKELLVIHGWGRHATATESGVLKKLVLDMLEYRYKLSIRGYKTALPRQGGEGATLVTLK